MIGKLKVGFLGYKDGSSSQALLKSLEHEGIALDFIVFNSPTFKENYKRSVYMIKKHGILAFIDAVISAVFKSNNAIPTGFLKTEVFSVPHHNSKECAALLKKLSPDVLIISTNSILKSRIFDVPKIATLNAHPAWLPTYKGMGSSHYQTLDGYQLSVSVHAVDSGIDSGAVFQRDSIDLDLSEGINELRKQLFGIRPDLHLFMAKLLNKCIIEFSEGNMNSIDTSKEKTKLYKGGMPDTQKEELEKLLKSEVKLKRIQSIVDIE